MNRDTITRLSQRASGTWGSRLLRRLAARRLATAGLPSAAEALARAVEHTRDRHVMAIAVRAFDKLADQTLIDAVCGVWWKRRDSRLAETVARNGWVAARPVEVRILTALHIGKPEAIAVGGTEVAEELLQVVSGEENQVLRERAREVLRTLSNQAAREAVCAAAIDRGDEIALAAAAAADFAPREPGRHALLLFLAGRFEQYRELDFDGNLLRTAYIAAEPGLRRRLAAKARADGRVEWVQALTRGRSAAQVADLSGEDWETIRDVLAGARRWEDLWTLAQRASTEQAAAILTKLGASGWLPKREAERLHFLELTRIAQQCARYPLEREIHLDHMPDAWARCIAVSPDWRMLATSGPHGAIDLWRLPSGEPAGRIDAGLGNRSSFTYTWDGGLLVARSCDWELVHAPNGPLGFTGRARNKRTGYWNLPARTRAAMPPPEKDIGECLAVSQDGQSMLTGDKRRGLTLRRYPFEDNVRRLGIDFHSRLQMSADGSLLTAKVRGKIKVWRLPSGAHVVDIPTEADAIAISPRGDVLAASGAYEVALWHLPSGKPAGTLSFKGHFDHSPHLEITPDGGLLACSDADGFVQLWRLPTGEPAGSIATAATTGEQSWHSRSGSFAITPDSRTMVTSMPNGLGTGVVELWRLPSGERIAELHRGDRMVNLRNGWNSGLLLGDVMRSSVWLWSIRILTAVRTPVDRLGLTEVGALRTLPEPNQAERPWMDLIARLVGWRHQHDIAVDDPFETVPGATDIEVAPESGAS